MEVATISVVIAGSIARIEADLESFPRLERKLAVVSDVQHAMLERITVIVSDMIETRDFYETALRRCREIRNRHTFLDLADNAGYLPSLIGEL